MEVFTLSDMDTGFSRAARRYHFNDVTGIDPRNVNGQNNLSILYYQNYLLDKVRGFLVWENVPDNWDMEYLMRNLLWNGSVMVVSTQFGIIPLRGCPFGVNVYNKPDQYEIATPYVQGTYKMDDDGVVLDLKGNYLSFGPLFNRYAYMLASADAGVAVNMMVSRTPYLARASSSRGAKTFKAMVHQITTGNPAVCIGDDADFSWEQINIKNMFVAPDIQSFKRTIVQEFISFFGIQNANENKKERMITAEAESNQVELECNVQDWITRLRDQLEKVKDMFGLDIKVRHISEVANERDNDAVQPDVLGRQDIRDDAGPGGDGQGGTD